jgi:glycosyltransferase involved in cell wall biosynthesis
VSRELLVVMPVFNEEGCVEGVLDEWTRELDRAGMDYGLLLLDDGSTDGTPAILERWARERGAGRLEIVAHANRGHGQTCLEGYRRACSQDVPWVFQIDSDGQCDPLFFPAVWQQRHGHEVVYGRRARRRDGWKRVLASSLVRMTVKLATGADCIDANVPYRLMSTANLRSLVESIPSDFDLANIALAVQVQRAVWREASVPIVFRHRAGGEPSVPLSRFAGKACELLLQLARLPKPRRHA